MAKTIVATLVLGCAVVAFDAGEASAFGSQGYRPNDPAKTICWKHPRWSYTAAYYQTYRRSSRSYRGRARACHRRCIAW
jgi:hypothetical protein